MQQQKANEIAARQERLAGKNELAAAQREAEDRRREGRLIMSAQMAEAAASGAGSGEDAPTIMKILTDTGERVEYGAEATMYQGYSRRDDYFRSADAREASGRASFFGSVLSGLGSGIGGIGRGVAMLA
ncbi:MAG: hypothetical protein KAY22_24435 [Rhizorhabdus sp.]|uniref:hypothetical protein n=1 Tax=Rhizorhabdus sp. TaxID=1968843 RepID=UPI001B71C02A|nr:hypothetical protein [Rhizorhabdus sp.]MBP8235449.1 hypothetical protein [Rhizorhabdus sp.]